MFEFIKRLLPSTERSRLQEQLQNIHTAMLEHVGKMATLGASTMVDGQGKVGKCKLTDDLFKRANNDANLKVYNFNNIPELITLVVHNSDAKIDMLSKLISKEFTYSFSKSALTFKQLHILRLLDLMTFYTKYALRVMDYGFHQEYGIAINQDPPLLAGEIKWLEKYADTFIRFTGVLLEKDKTFESLIESTSDYVIEEAGEAAQSIGIVTDPHRLGFMPVIGDVILYFREQSARRQVERYEANKNRVTRYRLQIEKYRLERQRLEQGDDATVQKQIDQLDKQITYYDKLVKKLESSIQKYEAELEE